VTPVRDTRAVVGGAVAEESPGTGQVVKRKFAKTLRLTSDQLVSFLSFLCEYGFGLWFAESPQFETWGEHHYVLPLHVRGYCVYGAYLRMGFDGLGARFGH